MKAKAYIHSAIRVIYVIYSSFIANNRLFIELLHNFQRFIQFKIFILDIYMYLASNRSYLKYSGITINTIEFVAFPLPSTG